MPGEFTLQCEDCLCDFVVTILPRCPHCGFTAALCTNCLPAHDCDDAETKYREQTDEE